MEKLKINIPKGYEIDKKKPTFEEIVFKPVEKGLPKSWKELEIIRGYFVDTHSNVYCGNTMIPTEEDKNVFPTKTEARACIALAQLCQLRDVYNECLYEKLKNKELFAVTIQRKYVVDQCYVLAFLTRELRDEFQKNFADLIETAKPLL